MCKHSLSSETGQFSIQPLGKKKKKNNAEEHPNVSEVQKRREENGGAEGMKKQTVGVKVWRGDGLESR